MTTPQEKLQERLQSIADQRGDCYEVVARLHVLDGVLRRVAASPQREALVLRGGMVGRLMSAPSWRPAQDVDFLGLSSDGFDATCDQLCALLSADAGDGVAFNTAHARREQIFEQTRFPGARLILPFSTRGFVSSLQIDVGFGDPLDPPAIWLDYPTQLPEYPARVLAVQPETSFAWKVHGLFEFDHIGGHWRCKDLHDLYMWLKHARLNWGWVARAVSLAFSSRDTPIEAAFRLLSADFGRSRGSRRAWQAFWVERQGRDVPEDLDPVVDAVAAALRPVFSQITGLSHFPSVPRRAPLIPTAIKPGQLHRRRATIRRPDIGRENPPFQGQATMSMKRFSLIAHQDHTFYNPISPQTFDRILERLSLPPDATLIDIGAGAGEAILRALTRFPQAKGYAVDISTEVCERARARAAQRLEDPSRLTITEGDGGQALRAHAEAGVRFDLAFCLGSTHALGGYGTALEAVKRALKPNGLLLVAEGFWAQTPAPQYLTFLGAQPGDYLSHAGNVELAERCGFVPLYACTANAQEWDDYEWRYASNIEDFVATHPDDPDGPAMLARIRDWRRAFLTWGRDTLGFGLYVLRWPAP